MKEILLGETNLCLSGGAKGADAQWGMCAGQAGHKVIHWSFEGHKAQVPEVELVRLNDEQLIEAKPAVKRAAKALGKSPPYQKWVANLIYRNFYQVRWTNAVYAVSTLAENADGVLLVQGGTAWAVQMYLDRKLDEPDLELKCYVYCQNEEKWFSWEDGRWITIESPPKPEGIWTGIGTRDLDENGKKAIRDLLGYVKPSN